MRSSEAVGKLAGLLRGRELRGLEDAAVHLADERHGVRHALVPAGVAPCALASLTAGLQIFIACELENMENIIYIGITVASECICGTCTSAFLQHST